MLRDGPVSQELPDLQVQQDKKVKLEVQENLFLFHLMEEHQGPFHGMELVVFLQVQQAKLRNWILVQYYLLQMVQVVDM